MKRNGYSLAAAAAILVIFTVMMTTPIISQASGKVHVVIKGDTLWDISSFYIYDPFQWPQIWSANRDIENPHLIYPGQEIIIPELISRVSPAPSEARPPLPEPEPGPATMAEPAPEPVSEPEPEPVKITEEIKQEMILAMSTHGFIIEDEEIGLGTITSAEEDRLLIRPGMKIYIETENERPLWVDRRYSIVRVFDEVIHPVTNERVGYLAKVLGDMNVVHSTDKLTTGVVGEVYKEIMVGDHIIEHLDYISWLPKEISQLSSGLEGYIIIQSEGKSVMGENDMVFIDLGIEDGLQTGDTFDLVGERKKVEGVDPPHEVIGKIQVTVPRSGTSVARITESVREIPVGTVVIRDAR